MNTWFPQFKAFGPPRTSPARSTMFTHRGGAPVRNALNWSKEINVALFKFGQDAEVMFASHSWPRWATRAFRKWMRTQPRHLRQPQQPVTALCQPWRDHQRDPETFTSFRRVCGSMAGAQLSRVGGTQQPRRAQPFFSAIGRHPVNIAPLSPRDSAAALCRDDGRLRQNPGQGQGAQQPGQIYGSVRNPE